MSDARRYRLNPRKLDSKEGKKLQTAQLVSYTPEQVEALMENLDKAWAASDYAKDLKDKADKTAITARKARTKVGELMAEINKNFWQEGILPDNPEECVQLYESRALLTTQINLAVKAAGCDTATRRDYNDASAMFMVDARAIREEIRGSPIKASKKLDPKVLSRIITNRALKRKSTS
uniref:Uncharacterized protein n=1 Tax=viral metagenome TaxID=1070528 RepID=A0A6M3M4L3_9ZZZZ